MGLAKAKRGKAWGSGMVGSAYHLLPPAHLLQPTTTTTTSSVCVFDSVHPCVGRVEKDYLCVEESKWQGRVAKRNVLQGVYGDAAAATLSAAAAGWAVISGTTWGYRICLAHALMAVSFSLI